MSEREAIVATIKPIAIILDTISLEGSLCALMALTCQQICLYPPSERDAVLAAVMHDLPMVLDQTEIGMRIALAKNARDE